tara:strand:- start:940 stop:1452 length:513 start_codon:yes stop_codon:yes gene_type:complete
MKKHHKTKDKDAQIPPLKQLSQKVHQLAYQASSLITAYEQNKPRKVQNTSAIALTEETIKSIRIQKGIAGRINSRGCDGHNIGTYIDPVSGTKKSIWTVECATGISSIGTAEILKTIFDWYAKMGERVSKYYQNNASKKSQKWKEKVLGINNICRAFDDFFYSLFKIWRV